MAKTDRIDAHVLAEFGSRMRPRATEPLGAAQRRLQVLAGRRRQLVTDRTREMNRMDKTRDALCLRHHRAVIELLDEQLAEIEQEADDLILSDAELSFRYEALQSVPGVGPITARSLLTELPELGELSAKQIASLAGLAPLNRDSGTYRGQRRTGAGRAAPRTALYMATLTAVRCNGRIRPFHARLIAAGKPPKVALTACSRKLLIGLNAMLRDRVPWSDELVPGPRGEAA